MMLFFAWFVACAPRLYTDASSDDSGCVPWQAPDNRWPRTDALSCAIRQTGFRTGEVPPEIVGPDQSGASVSLWQFFGHVTVVDISTMWCAPCQDLAHGVQGTADAFADEGVVYVTILPENLDNEVPTVGDLAYWADSFGISSPVLSDTEDWHAPAVNNGEFPQVMVLDTELRICQRDVAANDAAVRVAIEGCL